ncbi:hypothetical protein AVEN_154622-1 [Araneus ventricosus]|uniref:Uncharacterized protein n=1 Tax=Araneus ventricosus TaxID=182803 RepID=A0A4Y2JXM3_ARAVE|nr:hypothetical protein AVEN_154622-1 [Araneus ventricosus]
MFSVAKKLFKRFVAAFASAIEGPGSSCSSSISEDESAIELFFSFTNATISSSLTSPDDQKVHPLPWLTPGQVSTGVRRGDRNCKEPCLLLFCPTYGVSSDSNKGTTVLGMWSWTRVFHAKGVTHIEVGLT